MTLPLALLQEVRKIGAGSSYTWLFAIVQDEDYDTESGTAYYVTSYDQEVTFPDLLDDTAPVARIHRPLGARVGEVTVDTAVSQASLSISVSNVFREASFGLETGDGFMGKRCIAVMVNIAKIDDGPLLYGEGYTRGAVANKDSATFSVELYSLASIKIPHDIFIVDRCRWIYGSPECGFPLHLVTGAHPPDMLRCGKTRAQCKERGDFETATLNRPRRHPLRFGGFLGLPRRLRR